ncbi:helix-turn-helix domain-containing protein [Chengkuizengella axinellae]|uniref:Helix-turn-helix domain-containing protein n=1 Tax=Chengkuizengella axinellae TaxID=3064388 RepID=A0ABT9J3Z0_9BACL|nr:helix-turn-helix domain-containing protein [Chengkuizengella sp. 2205SS18-9]MDP5276152.1 helix-turn-helix domain-containing protein [Chengkuizengella sp. 2205SS18-9]
MKNDNHQDMTTKEVADYLGLQMQTIHGYVQNKRLIPWNYDTWKIDGTYLFERLEVEKLKTEVQKPGLTTSDVLEFLKQKDIFVSEATLNTKIRSNEVPAEMLKFRNRDTYFIKEEDLDSIVEIFKNHRKRARFFNKKLGYYLFQPIINKATGEVARVIELNDSEGFAITTTEKKIEISDLKIQGFEPQINIKNVKNNKKGYITFEFPRPRQIQSNIFNVLDILIKESGINNIRLDSTEFEIKIEVKPVQIHLDKSLHQEEIELLNSSLIDGVIIDRPNGIVLHSKLTSFLAYGSMQLKEEVKKYAKKENLSLEEFVIKSLEEAVKRRQGE